MLLNCGVGEDSWESLGLQGDPTSPFWRRSALGGCSLEGMMLKLKLQYFGYLMWIIDSLEKSLLFGRNWSHVEKGTTEDEMPGWHHRLNGYEFEKAPEVVNGQGSLVCCSPLDHKELDMTEQLNGLIGANNRSCRCLWSNNEVQSSFTLELLVWKFYSTPIPLTHFLLGKYYLPHRE